MKHKHRSLLRVPLAGLALALCAALGCAESTAGNDGGDDPNVDQGARDAAQDATVVDPGAACQAPPAGSDCPVRVRYASPTGAVYIAGEFNGWKPTADRLVSDGSGQAITLRLPPGLYGYKLIVDGTWQLDPQNAYRKYVEGTENSGLRVADCSRPGLLAPRSGAGAAATSRPAAGQGTFGARVDLVQNRAGQALCSLTGTVRQNGGAPRPLSASELVLAPDRRSAQLSLTGLADGKYTVSLTPSSGGQQGDNLLLPFWIEAQPFQIRDTPLYMAVTDRFRDGDRANNPPRDNLVPLSADYQGGDLAGITAALKEGYFDERGVKALWITPWYTQPSAHYRDQSGAYWVTSYHGYWPTRAREVDPRLGGADALRALVSEAHRHGVRVLMDSVLNHVHEEHEYFKDQKSRGWFRTGCVCGTPGCDWTDKRLECLFTSYLPDINWTLTDASERFIADTLWWLEEFDLDGLRIDAVKHVEDLAILNLGARARERFEQAQNRLYLVGETAMGWGDGTEASNADQYNTIKRYMGPAALDGQFDFVLYHAVPYRVFARDESLNRRFMHTDFWTRASLRQFSGFDMVKFLGSHDNSRFVTLATYRGQPGYPTGTADNKWSDEPKAPPDQEPYDRLYLAMLNLMTAPGVPLLYYGDEYGEYGGGDPDNRHFMRSAAARSARENSQDARMTALLKARQSLSGLRRGDSMPIALLQEDLYAYARVDREPAQGALVVLNRLATPQTTMILIPAELGWSAGTALRDLLTGADVGSVGSGIMVTVPARGGLILARK